MTATQIFFPEQNSPPALSQKLFDRFPHIACDPTIHAGWPHIKGTRILASDILRAQIQGYSMDKMIMEFAEMGIHVAKEQLLEACDFTIEWLHFLNEKTISESSK